MDLVFNLGTHPVKDQQINLIMNQTPCIMSITIIVLFQNFQQVYKQVNKYLHLSFGKPLTKFHIVPIYQPQKLLIKTYDIAAVGGTFDYLHVGHKILLTYCAFTAIKQLIIGITGTQMLQKKKNKEIIQSFKTRQTNVIEFVRLLRPDLKITISYLLEPFGPTIVRQDIDALIVSQQTIKGGQAVNKARKDKQFKQLDMIVCPALSQAENSQNTIADKISSSIIRQGILKKSDMVIEDFINYKHFWMQNVETTIKILNIQLQGNQVNQFTGQIQSWWDWIVASYSQYWRYYHTNGHIYTLLNAHQESKKNKGFQLSSIQQVIAVFSIFFHDSIYIISSKNNQKKSAEYLQKFFDQCFYRWTPSQTKKILNEIVSECKDIIIATETHDSKTSLQIYFNDLDMSILNSSSQEYRIYAQRIRKQYQPSVGGQYVSKRIQFLNSFEPKTAIKNGSIDRVAENVKWQIQKLTQQLNSSKEG